MTGFYVVATKYETTTLNLSLPICPSCRAKIESRNSLERAAIWAGIFVGGGVFIFVNNAISDIGAGVCFGLTGLIVVSFTIGRIGSAIMGYSSEDGWGRFDGRTFVFKKRAFAEQFFALNPMLQ
jgi:hypothetical protein